MDNNERVLTCVYCGMEYPQHTPSHGAKILTDHIKVCEKHPMREAEAKIAKLKAALIGLVGSGEKEELLKMEVAVRTSIAPDADKTAAINAIHALLSLLERR